jgi:hypothetical protein
MHVSPESNRLTATDFGAIFSWVLHTVPALVLKKLVEQFVFTPRDWIIWYLFHFFVFGFQNWWTSRILVLDLEFITVLIYSQTRLGFFGLMFIIIPIMVKLFRLYSFCLIGFNQNQAKNWVIGNLIVSWRLCQTPVHRGV